MNVENRENISGLSILFPAYNDAGTIPSMVLMAQAAAREFTDNYEIIVVDDGSQDHTALVLAELKTATVLLDEEAVSASSGKKVHRLVLKKPGLEIRE